MLCRLYMSFRRNIVQVGAVIKKEDGAKNRVFPITMTTALEFDFSLRYLYNLGRWYDVNWRGSLCSHV